MDQLSAFFTLAMKAGISIFMAVRFNVFKTGRAVPINIVLFDDALIEMMNVTVIAESTPGPIAINCATYVGYKQKGLAGAIAATVGMVLPSFCIIFLISMFLDNFLEITWIAHAFRGIRIAVGILILDAAIRMIRKMQKKPFPLAVMITSFAAMLAIDIFALRISSITLMLIAAAVSLALFLVKHGGKEAVGK